MQAVHAQLHARQRRLLWASLQRVIEAEAAGADAGGSGAEVAAGLVSQATVRSSLGALLLGLYLQCLDGALASPVSCCPARMLSDADCAVAASMSVWVQAGNWTLSGGVEMGLGSMRYKVHCQGEWRWGQRDSRLVDHHASSALMVTLCALPQMRRRGCWRARGPGWGICPSGTGCARRCSARPAGCHRVGYKTLTPSLHSGESFITTVVWPPENSLNLNFKP